MSKLSLTSDPYRLVDEPDDFPSSPLEVPLGEHEDIGRPEQDTEEHFDEMLDDCVFPSLSPPLSPVEAIGCQN